MTDLLVEGQLFATRYRIERFLARGGFGAVYVAEQLATELRVALKVLWPHVLQSADAVEKFQQEARIAGRVNSEHIVRVFDAGFDLETGMPFLVMELLDGMDLDRVVREASPLQPAVAVAYLRQVASGLDKAHRHVGRDGAPTPIVHRDLKPENLFLCRREDGSPLVKVLDFGIAKVLSDSTKMSQDIKGTPLYMASEQLGGGAITPRTDVWALGLIAFFLLSGKEYWRSAHARESTLMLLMGEVLTQPLAPPSARLRELGEVPPWPPAFDEWFSRCVNREPSHRFPSAGEAIAALATALESAASGDSAPHALGQAPLLPLASTLDGSVEARTRRSSPPGPSTRDSSRRVDLAESTAATVLPRRAKGTGVLMGGVALAGVAAAVGLFFVLRQRPSDSAPTPLAPSPLGATAPSASTSANLAVPPPPASAAPSALAASSASAPPSATPSAPQTRSGAPRHPAAQPAHVPAHTGGAPSTYDER